MTRRADQAILAVKIMIVATAAASILAACALVLLKLVMWGPIR